MGQRSKITYRDSSSYLLQELIHRCQESETDLQVYENKEDNLEGEDEVESEESSESEMLNLEVCFPHPDPLPPGSFPQPWGPATSAAASRCTLISSWLSPFLGFCLQGCLIPTTQGSLSFLPISVTPFPHPLLKYF